MSGEGSAAYLTATLGIVATALIAAGVGCWLWDRTSARFRNAVDRFRYPDAADN